MVQAFHSGPTPPAMGLTRVIAIRTSLLQSPEEGSRGEREGCEETAPPLSLVMAVCAVPSPCDERRTSLQVTADAEPVVPWNRRDGLGIGVGSLSSVSQERRMSLLHKVSYNLENSLCLTCYLAY